MFPQISRTSDSRDMAGERVIQWTAVPSFPNAIACEKKSVADITPDAFERDYVHRAIPCVLTDVTAEWPCRARWSLDFFAREHGDLEISVDDGRKEKVNDDAGVHRAVRGVRARRGGIRGAGSRGKTRRPGAVPANVELRGRRSRAERRILCTIRLTFATFSQTLKPTWRPPFTWLFLGPRAPPRGCTWTSGTPTPGSP